MYSWHHVPLVWHGSIQVYVVICYCLSEVKLHTVMCFIIWKNN